MSDTHWCRDCGMVQSQCTCSTPDLTPAKRVPMELRKLSIMYTGTLVTPDGSDTGVYGDPCEPGDGESMEDGWWAPDWARFEVSQDPAYGTRDVWEVADGDPVEWLRERLADRIGDVERETISDRTVYATSTITDVYTSTFISPAAHPEGFTWAEVAAAVSA